MQWAFANQAAMITGSSSTLVVYRGDRISNFVDHFRFGANPAARDDRPAPEAAIAGVECLHQGGSHLTVELAEAGHRPLRGG